MKESISEEIKQSAKKLKINPKFLLFAIAALCNKKDATEADILQQYFNAREEDFKQAEKVDRKRIEKARLI